MEERKNAEIEKNGQDSGSENEDDDETDVNKEKRIKNLEKTMKYNQRKRRDFY